MVGLLLPIILSTLPWDNTARIRRFVGMEHKCIIEIAQYAAPYKGNFIASLEQLEEKLKEAENKVIYIFPEECKKTAWIDEFTTNRKQRVYFVRSPKKDKYLWYDQKLIGQLETIFKICKPDIIHSHFDGYDEYCAIANKYLGGEIVIHYHNPHLPANTFRWKLMKKIIDYQHYGIYGNGTSAIILGEPFRKEMRDMGYKQDIFLLPNGIDCKRIEYFPKLNSKDRVVFLAFGGRGYSKGIDILLKAAQNLHSEGLDFKLIITEGADNKTFLSNIDMKLEQLPEVTFVPNQENVSELFREADCFISASRYETFSYAIAEAMLAGKRIVSSSIKGVMWALEQPTVDSFKSEDHSDLTEKMRDIILRKQVIKREQFNQSRDFILNNYSADIWCKKLLTYFDSILMQ